MTKRGGYQQTAAGAFGAGEAPLTAEECAQLARWVERSESTESDNREWNLVWDILTREARVSLPRLLATITALRAEVADAREKCARLQADLDACGRHAGRLEADARQAALLEAAELLEREAATCSAEEWRERDEVSDMASALRARAATPAPPAAGSGPPRAVSPAPASGPERELLDEAFGGGGAPAPPEPDPRDARIDLLESVGRDLLEWVDGPYLRGLETFAWIHGCRYSPEKTGSVIWERLRFALAAPQAAGREEPAP